MSAQPLPGSQVPNRTIAPTAAADQGSQTEHAQMLAGRFDNSALGPDVLAALESDLSAVERLLDPQAVSLFRDERPEPSPHIERISGPRITSGPGIDEAVRTHEAPDNDLSSGFGAHLARLRQVDQKLEQLDRCIARARGDPPLRRYWRGVDRQYREEAHQLTRRIGREAIWLDRR